jgi:ABC-type molybdenum transport system ATPase subunit/photorepair protein PhrA
MWRSHRRATFWTLRLSPIQSGSAGETSDLDGARLIVLAAGTNQKSGETRLDLLSRSAEIFAEIGPDGVGKSTLLGLIAGVKIIQSGEVVLFDKTIADKETLRDIRGRIATCHKASAATSIRRSPCSRTSTSSSVVRTVGHPFLVGVLVVHPPFMRKDLVSEPRPKSLET